LMRNILHPNNAKLSQPKYEHQSTVITSSYYSQAAVCSDVSIYHRISGTRRITNLSQDELFKEMVELLPKSQYLVISFLNTTEYGVGPQEILERCICLFQFPKYGQGERTTILLVRGHFMQDNCTHYFVAIENSSPRGNITMEQIMSAFPEIHISDLHVQFYPEWRVCKWEVQIRGVTLFRWERGSPADLEPPF
jgi:hypothetical protein